MKHLFAFHLTEEIQALPVLGAYDPEQQLWICDDGSLATFATTFKTITATGSVLGGADSDEDDSLD